MGTVFSSGGGERISASQYRCDGAGDGASRMSHRHSGSGSVVDRPHSPPTPHLDRGRVVGRPRRVRVPSRSFAAKLLFATALVVGAFAPPAQAARTYVLKFASLAPEGSTWQNGLQAAADEIKERSDGRLIFRMYPGGVAGDEKDVLRKIKIGQLHGAAFTGVGLGEICPSVRVMELPFCFRNYDEVDHVSHDLMPRFAQGFDGNGFKLLGWMEVGFIQFFSKHPIHSLDELRQSKIWMWEGDPLAAAFFAASDIHPVPLSITEVLTSLSTNLIDTVYASPLGAIALQWSSKVSYMSEVPMANGIAGVVVSRRFFDRLPKDLQKLLKEVVARHCRTLIERTREDNEKSMEIMKDRGIEVTLDRTGVDQREVDEIKDRAMARLVGELFSQDLLDAMKDSLREYRAEHGDSGR
jgi:TRAP-type C4-dicarboxylate transport system substrate-binding protein